MRSAPIPREPQVLGHGLGPTVALLVNARVYGEGGGGEEMKRK